MYRKARFFVLCCALLIALTLIVSGCSGGGASNAGSGNGVASGSASGTTATGGDSGQAGLGGQSGASGSAAGDGDGEAFDLNETGRPSMYDVISRFETIAYRIVSTSDELDWASIHISFLGTGDHESGPVDQYLITISGPDLEFGDELLEMWFAQDGRLVAVRDGYDDEVQCSTSGCRSRS